jgi:hypothetical protein
MARAIHAMVTTPGGRRVQRVRATGSQLNSSVRDASVPSFSHDAQAIPRSFGPRPAPPAVMYLPWSYGIIREFSTSELPPPSRGEVAGIAYITGPQRGFARIPDGM